MTEYVATADALFFHHELIRLYGGAPGIRDAGALESALHRPRTGYYGTIIEEAAALLESLVQSHPFVDGNKRVAFAAVDVFLRINGYVIAVDSSKLFKSFVAPIESQDFSMEYLVPWLTASVNTERG